MESIDTLLSLPPAAADAFEPWSESSMPTFVGSDPPGRQLGSGGGTAHLMAGAVRAAGAASFAAWLSSSRKLIVHGSGQSRRLPAYAAEGKPQLPLPLLATAAGQSVDQRLLDVQLAAYRRLFWHAPAAYRLMVACGDVLLRNEASLPLFPEADVLIMGIPASPEEATHHGVMFCDPGESGELRFFLQKPSPAQIRSHADKQAFYLDTGVWLFTARALTRLLACCGWQEGTPPPEKLSPYELFDRFATALGREPAVRQPGISDLTAAVLPLPEGRFYHFGTNRSVLHSVAQLTHPPELRRSHGHGTEGTAHAVVLNATVAAPLGAAQTDVWIDASHVPASWRLTRRHVLTGIPANDWSLALPPGACIDAVPLARPAAGTCWRVYGFDDPFRGALEHPGTHWFGRPFAAWLQARGLTFERAGLDPTADIQEAPLFPVADAADPTTGALLAWMIAETPGADAALAARWCAARRRAASDLLREADTRARQAARQALQAAQFAHDGRDGWLDRCARLDLETTAQAIRAGRLPPPPPAQPTADGLAAVHDAMFRARLSGGPDTKAFSRLRDLLVGRMELDPVDPQRDLLDDQIVWGRAPIRLDLAGGWTDTPPYCLEHGGRVVNLAGDLNGQPPIQVFARICEQPQVVLHSIDLGSREVLGTWDDLLQPAALGGGFSIARAALRLAGFDARFRGGPADEGTLARFLERRFGGGIELSMLAAIPKGSGLGTSSILASTILGTLGELCGLHWSHHDLFTRTLVLEQMLGSGGGWQDQVGGIVGGAKLIETVPGLVQKPVVRWLPHQCLAEAMADQRVLLYYTGLTRVAHNILGEIVRGIFLNDARRIATIEEIGHNATFAADAIQRQNWPAVCEAVRRSWALNQALDAGTNPPAVQEILARIAPWTAGAKLLGAGGGGYLVIFAPDGEAGRALRKALAANPPNPRARFVDLTVSTEGLRVTRS